MNAPDWVELTPDEEILWTGRPTLWRVVGPVIGGLILIVIGGGLAMWFEQVMQYLSLNLSLPGWARFVPLVLVAWGLLTVGIPSLDRIRKLYIVTNEEVYVKQGIISRDVEQMRLDRIQNTSCDQSILERILSVGTIVLYTAGSDTVEIVFENVPNPTEVNGIITRALDETVTQTARTKVR